MCTASCGLIFVWHTQIVQSIDFLSLLSHWNWNELFFVVTYAHRARNIAHRSRPCLRQRQYTKSFRQAKVCLRPQRRAFPKPTHIHTHTHTNAQPNNNRKEKQINVMKFRNLLRKKIVALPSSFGVRCGVCTGKQNICVFSNSSPYSSRYYITICSQIYE